MDQVAAAREKSSVPLSHVIAVTAGNALEFYDFVTYALFAIYIGRAFFPSQDAASSLLASLATFGAGFLTRPIGGMVLGSLGDRLGRKPALLISFSLMGLGIAGIALTPDYRQIGIAAPILAILFRLIQGFAVGGEVGPSTAFLIEAAPDRRRAAFTSLQTISQNISILVGSGVGLAMSLLLTAAQIQAFGWRLALLIGVAIVPFGLWMRRKLPETLTRTAAETKAPRAKASAHRRVLAAAFFMLTGGTMATYVSAYMTTWAMDTLHMSASVAFGRSVLATLVTIASTWAGALLSDRFGRRPLMIWPTAAAVVLAPAVYLTITTHPSILTLYLGAVVLSAVLPLAAAAMYTAMAESLPPEIRSGAIATVYAFAIGIFGGSTQFVLKWLLDATGSAMTPGWYLTGAALVMFLAALTMRESAPARRIPSDLLLAPAG